MKDGTYYLLVVTSGLTLYNAGVLSNGVRSSASILHSMWLVAWNQARDFLHFLTYLQRWISDSHNQALMLLTDNGSDAVHTLES